MVTAESDSDSQRSGHIDSDANSAEFVRSLETSFDNSTPLAGKRRSRDRTPEEDGNLSDEERRQQRKREQDDRRMREDWAREKSDEIIRDVQRNKADLAKPAGEWSRELETLLIDMKHFHLTSHVDRKLRESILEGDFTIDFRKLIPQSRSRCKVDQRLQVVNKDGMSYFVPADKDTFKDISGYRQWEIAFRVFMGVYLSKWPDRAGELLEYSHVIQTASLTYPWECVYNYDIAIREIMTGSPGRLWGKICQHTWALELGEPTAKTAGAAGVSNTGTVSTNSRGQKKVCWRFNKGRCPFGSNCEFDHRCSVCGGRSHGRHNCFKRGRGGEKQQREFKKERQDK